MAILFKYFYWIGIADLYGSVNASWTNDRFGTPNSALRLDNGYYEIPSSIYFGGSQFSILVWVKVKISELHQE